MLGKNFSFMMIKGGRISPTSHVILLLKKLTIIGKPETN